MREQISRLRAELEQAQTELIEAEAELADQLAEVNAFEFEFEARVGHFVDKLAALEEEIEKYHDRIELMRKDYIPVERQYQRAWQAPRGSAPTPPPSPPSPADEAQIKKLYRRLARRFHPDLAVDESDRVYRTQTMSAINDAYAARSLVELEAIAAESDSRILTGHEPSDLTEAQMIRALQNALTRCHRRLREIEGEMRSLHQRPSVQLSLEAKMARRRGRDLLAEMAAELEQKVARKTVERDMLKAQFDQLGPDQGIIPIG